METEERKVTVRGVLRFADATHEDSGQIKIVDENAGATHSVKVPEGTMGDIVRPLWGCRVVVTGTKVGSFIVLGNTDEQWVRTTTVRYAPVRRGVRWKMELAI